MYSHLISFLFFLCWLTVKYTGTRLFTIGCQLYNVPMVQQSPFHYCTQFLFATSCTPSPWHPTASVEGTFLSFSIYVVVVCVSVSCFLSLTRSHFLSLSLSLDLVLAFFLSISGILVCNTGTERFMFVPWPTSSTQFLFRVISSSLCPKMCLMCSWERSILFKGWEGVCPCIVLTGCSAQCWFPSCKFGCWELLSKALTGNE